MRISAMEEYGLRALLCLARKAMITGDNSFALTIPELSEEEGLSVPYASKIMRKLRQGGLVAASRGRIGGYHLTEAPEKITLYRALVALGGPVMAANHCARYSGVNPECVHLSGCTIRGAFGGLATYIENFLTKVTLADLTGEEEGAKRTIHNLASKAEAGTFKKIAGAGARQSSK